MRELTDVTELTVAQTLHPPLPLVLSVVAEADKLTMAQTLHALPLVLSVVVTTV